jgi:hypothetical protein
MRPVEKVKEPCRHCGTTVTRQPSHRKKLKSAYCNRDCYHAWRRANAKPRKKYPGTKEQWKAWRKTWLDKQKASGCCEDCALPVGENIKYCAVHRERRRLSAVRYQKANGHTTNQKAKESIGRMRRLVIAAYGGKCECCGVTEYEFLNIDHKNNDGAEHRKKDKKTSTGYGLYRHIIKTNFPRDRFRLLCWNCNCSRGIYGRCPHEAMESTCQA